MKSKLPFKKCKLSVFKLLQHVRSKPQYFLDDHRSLQHLRTFLVGFDCALGSLSLIPHDANTLREFQEWVAQQLGFTSSTAGWCNMILEKSDNDEHAYNRFFELIDQFYRKKKVGKTKKPALGGL